MSKSLKMKLSKKGVSDLIKRLQSLQEKTEQAVIDGIVESVDPAIATIRSVASAREDTGESLAGIGWEITANNKGVIIYQEGTHVFENEFGNGWGFGTYPKPEVIPSGQPTNSGPYSFEPNPESRKWFRGYDEEGNIRKNHARGQTPDAQMYQGSLVLREELPKRIKQKVGEVLSQV